MCCALLLESTASEFIKSNHVRSRCHLCLILEHSKQKLQPVSGDGKRRPSTAKTPATGPKILLCLECLSVVQASATRRLDVQIVNAETPLENLIMSYTTKCIDAAAIQAASVQVMQAATRTVFILSDSCNEPAIP